MDRRRFSPSAEGLEGRALLSLFGGLKTAAQNTTINVEDLPKTYKEKELRIANLPFFLLQEQPDRFLPPTATQQLQTDINSVVAQFHGPTADVVDAFNANLRHLLPYNTLSATNIKIINASFGDVLESAGATPQQQASLQNDMLQIASVDAVSVNPSLLARNDYSLVLQTTMAVARPGATPTAPSLQAKDGTKTDGGRIGLTHDPNPIIVGQYAGGATKDGQVWMQILDDSGQVLGTTPVNASGQYTIRLDTLVPGVYHLRSRAVDEVGHLTDESNAFTLFYEPLKRKDRTTPELITTVPNLPPPGGPLAL